MKRVIFYSWQSDLDASLTRSFIESALQRAAKNIARDNSIEVEPVIDRDTKGVEGTPEISNTIYGKIMLCDVFVCDISIVNSPRFLPNIRLGRAGRRTPNPNVLVELGFAIARLGWDRILLVQNKAFGMPEDLPFDLRGRRVISFNLPSKSRRSEERESLRDQLELTLRKALRGIIAPSTPRTMSEPLWWGYWQTRNIGAAHGGTLFIREVCSQGFLFHLSVFNGSHTGSLSGVARLVSADSAYAWILAGNSDKYCELSFKRTFDEKREIVVTEEGACHQFRGIGTTFDGKFVRTHEALFDSGILDEMDLVRLYGITGQFYQPLAHCFQGLSEGQSIDTFPARVTIGAPRGLYTISEGIIMRGERGELWACFIDNDVVRYFTTQTDYRQTLPLTIESWRERFKEKEVVFDSQIEVIPKF